MRPLLFGLLGFTMSLNGYAAGHVEVGEVTYSRGVLTGQLDGEEARLIGKGVGLHNGETLNTGSRGIALIELNDGTRMTLRPNTTFKIENVNTDKGSENALLSLFRGGFRAVTGFISKVRQDAFQVNTSVATIGIRGTEFDARLCGGECQEEEDAIEQKAQRETRVVGRIALMRGKASAVEDGKEPRVLSVGAAIYERDQLETGIKSFAVIAFNDKTRITMSPESAFRVEEHEYKPDQPDENNSFLSFLKGGLRLVTGAIGRLNQQSFRVATPTATIGIRGTGFDIVCAGPCVSNSAAVDPTRNSVIGQFLNLFLPPAFAQSESGGGIFYKVWQGAIYLDVGGRETEILNGRTLFLKNSFSEPIPVADIPARLGAFGGAPRPDKVPDNPNLFDETSESGIDPGLYVNVRDGDVVVKGAVDGKELSAGGGEAIRAGFAKTERLSFVPAFQKHDPVPDPALLGGSSENRINLLRGKSEQEAGGECI